MGVKLPDLPPTCREKRRSGVALGDRADTALLRTDAALSWHHAQTDSCAGWYDDLKAGLAVGAQ
ncbi:hypothetical protein HKX54_02435 [Sulfitobacter sp. M57]|uniref:hypothetical protein n=1 Tax=unclassified Sulfitobacter TaxID=196795 RepID=UPI0023E1C6F6|nr:MULTISPECIES: hypothetical protein [unclassified Sulfitobacter]MDF3413301.1 hypothetical protein [Sulfitobacter sp. KE5]MDF3431848.1 hypothetical protein [Sulfitobacter sp. KE42]MDF3457488.1 hypothetical protein [Sulfitobacter sp. S74]MDF3461390.1 hypothetical protein [Sulfitobacter sp. Ks18]MDF3465290.1 hypothetical protein [Sulfitobacter sp. M05]